MKRWLEVFLWGMLLGTVFAIARQALSSAPYDSVLQVTHGDMKASAVYIGHDYFLTAAHVSSDTETDKHKRLLNLPFTVGGEAARVVWSDPQTEIGVFKAVSDVQPVDLSCDGKDPVIGDDVQSVGYPYGEEKLVSFGRVAAGVDSRGGVGIFQQIDFVINAQIMPGMSGGGVFDKDGKLVGINSATWFDNGVPIPVGFVIPRSVICKELHDKGILN